MELALKRADALGKFVDLLVFVGYFSDLYR